MSSVERGLGGVWSCLYCEGTWLPPANARSLTASLGGEADLSLPVIEALKQAADRDVLTCTTCHAVALDHALLQSAEVHRCPSCEGVFFKKGVLQALAPASFSVDQEAPVLQALAGTLLLGDAGALLVSASIQQRQRERAR